MRPADEIEKHLKHMSFKAGPEMDKALWADALKAQSASQETGQAVGRDLVVRTVMSYPIAKLAVAAAMVCVAIILWRTLLTSRAYALSDIPGLLGQARTIHIRSRQFIDGEELLSEYWYDAERGRKYEYRESLEHAQGPNGRQTVTTVHETIHDGRFIMHADHSERTVRFERLLPSEQALQKLMMGEFALNVALRDHPFLDRYTKIGRDRISGQSYDIWQREFESADADLGIRLEVWVSPSTGDMGRTRRWINHYRFGQGWMLASETDKVEINVLPPLGVFATVAPAGYTLENSKTTADITGAGHMAYQTPDGCELRVPLSLVLEDGSVLACWSTTCDSVASQAHDAYENLTFGEGLPQTPCTLHGLISIPDEKSYGSISYRDEDTPITIVYYVGRHVACTYSAGKVCEWALYVPQPEVPAGEPISTTVTVVKLHRQTSETRLIQLGSRLISLVVTRARFAEYVAGAMCELSENAAIPAEMIYEHLLELAKQVRGAPELYNDFKDELREEIEECIGGFEPVEVSRSEPGTKNDRGRGTEGRHVPAPRPQRDTFL